LQASYVGSIAILGTQTPPKLHGDPATRRLKRRLHINSLAQQFKTETA
jgi:hypothetical protein